MTKDMAGGNQTTINLFNDEQKRYLENSSIDFLFDDFYFGDIDLDKDNISNKLTNIFESYAFYDTHIKALITNITDNKISLLMKILSWVVLFGMINMNGQENKYP